MADKPSRALVLYGDGLARSISPAHNDLHSLASRALCGFLALPNQPHSENEDLRVVREFAELLDSNEAYESSVAKGDTQEKCSFPTVAERFMGMKAAIVTDNLTMKSFGGTVGFKLFSWNEMSGSNADPSHLASELLKLLGFQEGKTHDQSDFELIFVHIEAKTNGVEGIDVVNRLVGGISDKSVSESYIGSRLHISVIVSYEATQGEEDLELLVCNTTNNAEFSHLFPRQSYMMKSGNQEKTSGLLQAALPHATSPNSTWCQAC